MSLLDLYDLSLRGRGDADALEVEEPDGSVRALTFGELEHRSNRLAHVLRARGLRCGDRIAFCLVNRLAVIHLWLAAVTTAAIVVPVYVLYRDRDSAHILADAAPRAEITSRDRAAEFAATDVWDVDDLDAEADASPSHRPPARLDASTPAALVYTSGTTG